MHNKPKFDRHPSCAILIATHNGERWLPEQLRSIYDQVGVSVKVFANDDASTDGTKAILEQWESSSGLEQLPSSGTRMGSANKNFLRLIRDVDIGTAEYVALADQDDVWHADKLAHAISRLTETGLSAYSSDVEAFWPNRTRIVRKSHPQKAWDHLFSSPGPGCTFVFRKDLFLEIRAWVAANMDALSRMWVHDWILYAYVRSTGRHWIIDDYVSMRYRQHDSNEIGANLGLNAIRARLARVFSGQYRNDILSISKVVGAPSRIMLALTRLSWRDRIWLLGHVHQFRRSFREVASMAILILLMRRT